MENITLNQIVDLIDKSSYVLEPFEMEMVEACRVVAKSGADLPPAESLQLQDLFEKIKRKGLLNL